MEDKVIRLKDLLRKQSSHRLEDAALCFGHFNVIHPGHVRHFHTARKHGSMLIVGLEADHQLSDTERKIVFPETDRADALAELDVVDYVVILDGGDLGDLARLIVPSALVLGKEFEAERSERVSAAVTWMKGQGRPILYEVGETRYATTDLFYGTQSELENQYWLQFHKALQHQNIDLEKVVHRLSKSKPRKLLVIGDTIIDQYIACDPIGMSNEAPVVVVKELETREFLGGAGIVAAHVAALGDSECGFLSVTGKDAHADLVSSKLKEFNIKSILFSDVSRPTTFKIRYLVGNQKLFRVSRLKEHALPKAVEDSVVNALIEMSPNLDGILVCDFVYGVVTPRIIRILRQVSKENNIPLFGDLQCSSQIGNVSKFKNFLLLCPTEREARIALGNQDDGIEYVANTLMNTTRSSNLIVKLGGEGFIAYSLDETNNYVHRQHFPALTVNPVDLAGAGDSLLAAVSMGLTHGLTLMEASALGCCVAAIAVQTVGNLPVSLEQVQALISKRDLSRNGV